MTLYKVTEYDKLGYPRAEKFFTSYRAAHAFEKTWTKGNKDPFWQGAMILYKYTEQKDGSMKEIYIGPSNW